ncbi:hypothetical protein B0A48_11192 [Cryoendolithus antarcticus]|uniref:Asp/Glu/hydantoin racemase n=1 Tax=Cryoendolithus antarcticus TaxID=1507870 RepID=A0A1V8SV11_9PEZI|nr:hypothetical protein B0A48_11192 [Cryoendolithus antarcticus]
MPLKVKLGVLVPSSNTSLEPLTTAILSPFLKTHTISVHFSRFPVTSISLKPSALSQFQFGPILAAAKLLADAEVDIIGWSGTSAGWLGFEVDDELCRRIEEETGVKATTSVLGLNRLLGLLDVGKEAGPGLGFVTPYLDDVQAKILEVYGKSGFQVKAESHLGKTVNVEFAKVSEDVLDGQMGDVMAKLGDGKNVVSTFCTNLRAAQRVEVWEAKYEGLVVLDTVATVVWDMLKITGMECKEIKGWGKMFYL